MTIPDSQKNFARLLGLCKEVMHMKLYNSTFINCRGTVFCSFRFLLIFPPF